MNDDDLANFLVLFFFLFGSENFFVISLHFDTGEEGFHLLFLFSGLRIRLKLGPFEAQQVFFFWSEALQVKLTKNNNEIDKHEK